MYAIGLVTLELYILPGCCQNLVGYCVPKKRFPWRQMTTDINDDDKGEGGGGGGWEDPTTAAVALCPCQQGLRFCQTAPVSRMWKIWEEKIVLVPTRSRVYLIYIYYKGPVQNIWIVVGTRSWGGNDEREEDPSMASGSLFRIPPGHSHLGMVQAWVGHFVTPLKRR